MDESYDRIRFWFLTGRWNEEMVRNAQGKWLTKEQCEEILSSVERT